MSDDLDISYSFQMGGTEGGEQPTDETLYAFAECEVMDLPDGNVLLVNGAAGRQLMVTRDVSIALKFCREFRSLKNHANFLIAYMPELGGDVSGVEQVLATVKDAGLMIGADDLCRQINGDKAPAIPLAPCSVCIITCDRPAAVERLLESMLTGTRLSGYSRLFLVDDSRDPDNARANEEAVHSFNTTCPKSIAYFGAQQQKQLMGDLLSALPGNEKAIRFLLDRDRWSDFKSYGLARTLCLLLTVGERLIVLDDDVLCTAVHSPHTVEGIRFLDDTRDADFYTNARAWLTRTEAAPKDPLAGHSQCLGMDLSAAIGVLTGEALAPAQLAGVDLELVARLHSQAPVMITQCGSLGDPGTGDNSWLWSLRPDSVARLLNSEGGLGSAFVNRHYWLGRTAPTFCKRASISQVTGLDNRRILPPFFPVFRGEDLVFGHMVDFLYPDSVVLEYPWAVPHLPLEERKGNMQGDSTAVRGGLKLAVNYLTEKRHSDPALSFETRLEALALLLQEVAECSDSGVLALYATQLAGLQSSTINTMSVLLRSPEGQAEDWTAYLRRSLSENVEALQAPATPKNIPGVPRDMSEEAVIGQIRAYAGDYATALRAWPAIREVASRLATGQTTH